MGSSTTAYTVSDLYSFVKRFGKDHTARASSVLLKRDGMHKEFSVCKKAADLPNRVLSGIGGLTDDSSATFDNSISNLYALVKRFGNGFAARGADFALAGGDGTPKAPFAYKKQPKPRLTHLRKNSVAAAQQWGLRLLPILYQICIRLSSGSAKIIPRVRAPCF